MNDNPAPTLILVQESSSIMGSLSIRVHAGFAIARKSGCTAVLFRHRSLWRKSAAAALVLVMGVALAACGGNGESTADAAMAPAQAAKQATTIAPGMATGVQRQATLMHFMLKSTWDQLGSERGALMIRGFDEGLLDLDSQKLTDECVSNLDTLKSAMIELLGVSDYPSEQNVLDYLLSEAVQSCRLNDLEIIGFYEMLRGLN